jgi:hypothetical protein
LSEVVAQGHAIFAGTCGLCRIDRKNPQLEKHFCQLL